MNNNYFQSIEENNIKWPEETWLKQRLKKVREQNQKEQCADLVVERE